MVWPAHRMLETKMPDRSFDGTVLDVPAGGLDNARVIAAWALSLRRVRDKLLGQDLFGEPAWEILLAIYAVDDSGTGLTAQELASHVNCSGANMTRWLRILVDRQLVDSASQSEGQRYSLAARAMSLMENLSR